MSLFNKIAGFRRDVISSAKAKQTLAAETEKKAQIKRYLEHVAKAQSRTRQDIASWNRALAQANSDEPRNFPLQLLYAEIEIDALLTSQMQNRIQQVVGRPFRLVNAAGDIDVEATTALGQMAVTRKLTTLKMEAIFGGCRVVELTPGKNAEGKPTVGVFAIPPENIVQQTGAFYPDYTEDKKIFYRDLNEYGTYILEYNTGTLGLLNKAVPHVLFKRFAQGCWSELCEIYGIPPRVLSTNTTDAGMLRRAEKMMSDMGAASWFIVDQDEKLDFATGMATDGAVFDKLINRCSNELSLLISGAVVGQDTEHGNRSKEESSQELLSSLIKSDLALMAELWNNTSLPALVKLGLIPAGLRWEYEAAEDLAQLWKITREALTYYTVDADWVKSKFGVEITGERAGKKDTGEDTAKEETLSAPFL